MRTSPHFTTKRKYHATIIKTYNTRKSELFMGKLLQVDWSQALNFDDEELFLYQLTDRQALLLLGQTDYLAWKTRYANLTLSAEELIEIRDRINHRLMTPVTVEVDCEDIEDCLETSIIITNINSEISNNTTLITNNTTIINNHETTIQEQGDTLEELVEQGFYNVYPDPPTAGSDPDSFCGIAWHIANHLNGYIQDVITDAATITYAEFITAILGLGGFKASLVKILWDFIIANSNPSLSTEVSNAVEYVAEAFYCNNLDVSLAAADIIENENITSDAEAAYIAAMDSLAVAQFSQLIYIGSLDETQDCTDFCPPEWCYTWDVSTGFAGWTIKDGTLDAQGLKSVISTSSGGQNNRVWLTITPHASAETIEIVGYRSGKKTVNTGTCQGFYGMTPSVNTTLQATPNTPVNINHLADIDGGLLTLYISTGWNTGGTLDTGGYNAWIYSITMRGTGVNPYGVSNC